MNELALFAGAGGGILGGKLLGWTTVCAVEWEAYPASVLIARQNEGVLPPFPIWDDVRTFDGRPWRGRVDVVSGGFPCQDISAAGKGAGIDGERSGMWAHMARIVREVGPRFVFVENSPMLTSRGLGRVLGDLAAMGYDARWGVLGAVDAGAPHKRDRIWIVADAAGKLTHGGGARPEQNWNAELANGSSEKDVADAGHLRGRHGTKPTEAESTALTGCGFICDAMREGRQGPHDNEKSPAGVQCQSGEPSEALADARSNGWLKGAERIINASGEAGIKMELPSEPTGTTYFSDADNARLQGRLHDECSDTKRREIESDGCSAECSPRRCGSGDASWWTTEPDVGRVAHGIPSRVDRLRGLGNAVVPQVAELIGRMVIDYDTNL